jgi:renalase
MEETEVLIIGSGLSGILLGQKLKEASRSFLILEKSAGLGGRLATRRIEGIGFDHGAPFFEPNTYMEERIKGLEKSDKGLFPIGGMSTLLKMIAKDLTIYKNHKVDFLKQENDSWIIGCDEVKFRAKKVIITAPLPQALELLEQNDIHYESSLKEITYSKALMLLFVTKDELILRDQFPEQTHSILPMAPRKLHPFGYVLRAQEKFSETYFHRSDEVILMALADLLYESTKELLILNHAELKKWKFAQAKSVHPEAFKEVQHGLFLMGDGFNYPDIRGPIAGSEALIKTLL